MKKLLFAILSTGLVMTSCKDDSVVEPSGYPTDNLTIQKEQKALTFTTQTFSINTTLTINTFRLAASYEVRNDAYHMAFVTDPSASLYRPIADSLMLYFGFNKMDPTEIFINGESVPLDPMTLEMDYEDATMGKPVLGLAHAVSENDTAYVIDTKVEFYKDTLVQSEGLMIETYMVGDIPARKFGATGEDFRFQAIKNYIVNTDSASIWDVNVPNLDSSGTIFKKGTTVQNQNVFLANANEENEFGTPLSEYWLFGGDFHEADIIGTADTPIRHFIPKLGEDEFGYERKVKFITVVWIFDPMTNSYTYLNSYSSNKFY